jgi:hypothetical protein
MVMTPDTAMMSPSSTISSLTQSTRGDTNQAIRDVLYGVNDSGIEVPSTPSLSTGNLGLRRLLIPDVLQLQEEDSIVLVLSQTSYLLPLYKGSILQDIRQKNPSLLSPSRLQLANSTLQQQHEIKRLGQSHFEFRAVVMLYPKRHLLFDDAIDAATLRLWVGQGEGFTVELLDYPGQTILVKWKDLQDVNALEIWRLATRKDALPPISFGHPRSMEAKCDDLNDALGAVSGDLTQTLNILLEYYKTESRMYRRRASDLIANSTKTTKLQADTYLDELQIEIQSSALDAFVTEVDDLYKMAILQHFNSFHYVNEPLLPSSTKNQLYHTLSKRFPMHCSVLDSICTTERNLRANNPNTLQKKQHSVLFHFLTLCRLRNKDYLCHWSMIETLAYEAKGLPPLATDLAVERRYATSSSHAFSILDEYSENGSTTLAAAIASETTLSAGIDNCNRSRNKTFQAGDKSSIMHKATVMYLRRNMLPRLSFSSQLFDTFTGQLFFVVHSKKMSPYHQLVRLRLLYISLPVPCIALERRIDWPNLRWKLVSLCGSPPKPKLTYLDQTIPPPMNLHVPKSWKDSDILFRVIPSMGPLESKRSLSVDAYWSILKRSQLLDVFSQFRWRSMRNARAKEVRQLVHHDLHRNESYAVSSKELRHNHLWSLLDSCSQPLKNARSLQARMMATYNEDSREPSSVVICPLYPRDEVSKKGSLLVLTNALQQAGFLHKSGDRHFKLGPFAFNRRLILFGDMLTDDMMASVKEHVISRLTYLGKEEYVSILNNAMIRSTHLNGMLHVKMHNLCVIFWFFYGGFLQALQAELRFKRIQQNPMRGHYKDHEVFAKLVFNALKAHQLEVWLTTVTEIESFKTADDPLTCLENSFQSFCDRQLSSQDDMSRLAANFMKEFAAFERLDSSIRCGDAVICEKEFIESLPRYKASKKFRYGNGVMRMCEVLYEESSTQLLELIRRNWSVVLNRSKGAIAPDDLCEKINLWTKLLPFTPHMERLVKKTENLSLARRCGFEIHDGYDVKSSTAPKRAEAYDRLLAFFERCQLFHVGERVRKLHDNSFWEFVVLNRASETQRNDRDKETVPLSAYEEELQTIFFSLKSSDAIRSPHYDDNERDNDDDSEDLLDDDNDEEMNDDNTDGMVVEQTETEEDRVAALNKLSQVKKYAVSQMALLDLDVVGREMLGPNLKENRSKQREDRLKEIAQIHEAVAHFLSVAQARRENLRAHSVVDVDDDDNDDETKREGYWEMDYVDILPRD